MEIRDKSGRKISLLNDSAPSLPSLCRATTSFPPRSELHRAPYSTLSTISTSTFSSNPPTPLLERSDSTDSAYLGRTPSPVTPHQLSMERLTLKHSNSNYGDPELYSNANPYIHIPMPYDPIRSLSEQSNIPTLSNTSSSNTSYRSRRAPVKSSKNTHPCPVASQYQCDRYFTTSGHAARHAKIHSGEKAVRCPECPKTFARKDNMDQHRKTHRRAAMQQQQQRATLTKQDSTDSNTSMSSMSSVDSREEIARKAIRKQRKRDMRISRSPDMPGLINTSEDSNASAVQTPDSAVFPADAFGRQRSGSNGNSLDMLAEAASTLV